MKRWSNIGLRRQGKVEGGRFTVGAGLEPRVEQWIEQQAKRFKVTRQMVMSVAIADYAGLKIDDKL